MNEIKTEGNGVAPENTPETAQPVNNEPASVTANPTPEVTTPEPTPTPTPEVTTPAVEPTPEPTPTVEPVNTPEVIPAVVPEPTPEVTPEVIPEPEIANISERLGEEGQVEIEDKSDAPVDKNTNIVDMISKLPPEQIQQLQEVFASVPRRKVEKVSYHTIELRQIEGKTIVAWNKSRNELRHDPVLQKEVMKSIIPVLFSGDEEYTDIVWREEFMQADRITCRVLDTRRDTEPRVVGRTFKRDEDGGYTSQEVEMYVNEPTTEMDIQLPSGEKITINGNFAN